MKAITVHYPGLGVKRSLCVSYVIGISNDIYFALVARFFVVALATRSKNTGNMGFSEQTLAGLAASALNIHARQGVSALRRQVGVEMLWVRASF